MQTTLKIKLLTHTPDAAKFEELDRRLTALESGQTSPGGDTSDVPEYVVSIWSPSEYPAYWTEITA